jgi:carbonic anhydrase/acetyltransferase-like protein (isoleucine patch superfamily)
MRRDAWITPFGDRAPVIHRDAYVDVAARLIGEVTLAREASIWPGAVLRADSASIRVGRRAAVLDLALLEAPDGRPVEVGDEAIVSHGAMVHGARVLPQALVGMGAIVLDGAVVSQGCIVGAGCVVPPGTYLPPNSLVLGIPGKILRETTEAERRTIADQVEELFHKSRRLRIP